MLLSHALNGPAPFVSQGLSPPLELEALFAGPVLPLLLLLPAGLEPACAPLPCPPPAPEPCPPPEPVNDVPQAVVIATRRASALIAGQRIGAARAAESSRAGGR